MDPIRKIPKKFTKKFGNKVINRQYFRRKTGLYCPDIYTVPYTMYYCMRIFIVALDGSGCFHPGPS